MADGLPPGFTTADLAEVDFSGDARARALDLSLADARFAPDVLEAAARRAVAAWAEAVDGDDDAARGGRRRRRRWPRSCTAATPRAGPAWWCAARASARIRILAVDVETRRRRR